jgi:tRNA A37 N6-isopentenylltransferase MiaA
VADAIATSTRQYAKRQETWFRHQPGGKVLTLDATRGPDTIASEIARAWDARQSHATGVL